jgi:hypothetical protein
MAHNYDEKLKAPEGWRTLKYGEPIPERHRFYIKDRGWSMPRVCRSTMTPSMAIATGNVIAYAAPTDTMSRQSYEDLLEQIKQKDKFIEWQNRVIESLTNAMDATSKQIQSLTAELKNNFKLK